LPRAACRLTVGGLAYEDRVDADLAAYNVPLLTVAAAARSAARASITDMQNGDASVPIDGPLDCRVTPVNNSTESTGDPVKKAGCRELCEKGDLACGAASMTTVVHDMDMAMECFSTGIKHKSENGEGTHHVLLAAASYYIVQLEAPAKDYMPVLLSACEKEHQQSLESRTAALPCRVLGAIGEIESKAENTAGENGTELLGVMAKPLQEANRAMHAAIGEQIKPIWSERSNAQQAMVYVRHIQSGVPTVVPGSSMHEAALAIDLENWEAAGPFMAAVGITGGCEAGEDGPKHFEWGVEPAEATERKCRFVPTPSQRDSASKAAR